MLQEIILSVGSASAGRMKRLPFWPGKGSQEGIVSARHGLSARATGRGSARGAAGGIGGQGAGKDKVVFIMPQTSQKPNALVKKQMKSGDSKVDFGRWL
jgi:hypothetical protein